LIHEQLRGGLILGGPKETFSEDQQDKFGVNADGDVQDEAKFKTAVAKVCAVRTHVTSDKLKIMTVRNMHEDLVSRTTINHAHQGLWQWLEWEST